MRLPGHRGRPSTRPAQQIVHCINCHTRMVRCHSCGHTWCLACRPKPVKCPACGKEP